MPELTAQRLRIMLDYDPTTGIFRRRLVRRGHRVGEVAGTLRRDGYRLIGIDGVQYMAHRLAWSYVHGHWPKGEIDHRNRRPDDNRIANLRDVTRSGNQQNLGGPRRHNQSGILGVHSYRGRWRARITVDGETRCLGYFDSVQEAGDAYRDAKRALHPFYESSEVKP